MVKALTRLVLIAAWLLPAATARAATPFMGLEPGVSTRAQVAAALGRETRISDTLSEYGSTIVNVSRILVEYGSGDIVKAIEVYFADAAPRESIVGALQLGRPTASASGPRLREFYGAPLLLALNYAGNATGTGVASVSYYVSSMFEQVMARAGSAAATSAAVPGAITAAPPAPPSAVRAGPRVEVSAAGSPARGRAGAPIEIVEFTNFQCSFCRTAWTTLQHVLDSYGERVRLVFRHFPLDMMPASRPAAEAAQCAHEQGRFWGYHDRLFAGAGTLSAAELSQTAAAVGLDLPRFASCVETRRYRSVVDADVADGMRAGVTGTPTFFINGRLLSGAQPFERFKELIDEELALQKR